MILGMAGSVVRGIRGYGSLVAAPGASAVILWGLVARVPIGMTALGLVLLVRGTGGSYADAGIITAANGIAIAVAAPVGGRLVDRRRPPAILLAYAVANCGSIVLLLLLAWDGAPVTALAAAAALVGATFPPIGPTIRKLWPRLVRSQDLRQAAFAFEATIQEIIFLTGPLLVGLITALAGWGAGMAGVAILTGAGVLGFVLTDAVAAVSAPDPAEHADRHPLAALAPPGIRRMVAFSVGFGLTFGAVEVAMPAFAEGHGGRALGAVALAAWSAGSLVGGLLAAGYAGHDPHRRLRVTSAAFAAVLALPLIAGSIETMAAAMFLAGLPIAPSFAITYGLVEDASVPGTQAEVFGWLSMAVVAGYAAGTAAGGILITHSGTDASIGLGMLGAATAAAVAWRRV